MPTNNSPIWSELWLRASQEEIGIAITFSNNPDYAINLLSKYRPRENFQDYTVCRTEDPNLIYIVRPGVTLEEFNLNDQWPQHPYAPYSQMAITIQVSLGTKATD